MEVKTVVNTLYAQEMDMGGISVRQALPSGKVDQIDPFLLLHHGSFPVEKGGNPLHMGVGPHPHRGFAPLTIVLSGEIHHRDSLGNNSVIAAGGVQWVHSGRGIIHSERPSAKLAKTGGAMEVIQLWINIPASAKMDPPAYLSARADQLPEIKFGTKSMLYLITGSYHGETGPIKSASTMVIARAEVKAGDRVVFDFPKGQNGAIYISRGEGMIGGFGMATFHNLYALGREGDQVSYEAESDTQLIVLSGEPIAEQIAHYGPFVMNNQSQIMEALRDYQMGKMGVLIEEE